MLIRKEVFEKKSNDRFYKQQMLIRMTEYLEHTRGFNTKVHMNVSR